MSPRPSPSPSLAPRSRRSRLTYHAGPLRLYRLRGSVCFLHSGALLLSLLPRSQCWCVDGDATFAMRIQSLIYRIELPHATAEDAALVADFRSVLSWVLQFEKTPCPFKRDSAHHIYRDDDGDDIEADGDERRRRASGAPPTPKVRRWEFNEVWRPEGAEKVAFLQPQLYKLQRQSRPLPAVDVPAESPSETVSPREGAQERRVLMRAKTFESMRSVTAPPQLTLIHASPASSADADTNDDDLHVPPSVAGVPMITIAISELDAHAFHASTPANPSSAFLDLEAPTQAGTQADESASNLMPLGPIPPTESTGITSSQTSQRISPRKPHDDTTPRPVQSPLNPDSLATNLNTSLISSPRCQSTSSPPPPSQLTPRSSAHSSLLASLSLPVPPPPPHTTTHALRHRPSTTSLAFSRSRSRRSSATISTTSALLDAHARPDPNGTGLISRACALLLGPPAGLVALMLELARSLRGSRAYRLWTHAVPAGDCGIEDDVRARVARVPGGWVDVDVDVASAGEDVDDEGACSEVDDDADDSHTVGGGDAHASGADADARTGDVGGARRRRRRRRRPWARLEGEGD